MTHDITPNHQGQRDRTIELLERAAEMRRRWRESRDTGSPADEMRADVIMLVHEVGTAGEWVVSAANRNALAYEISYWRRWLAEELGEYLPPVDLVPAAFDQSALQELDYPNLMILLARGETISGKLVRAIEFAKHLDEVREKFSESKIINCRFERCKFDGARFGAGTKLVYVTFAECTMDYLIWPHVRASSLAFESLDIRGSGFESGVFSDVLFRDFRTDRANFMDANFTYCRFDRATAVGTDFAGAVFSKCIFDRTQFVGCDLSDSVFSECQFESATVSGGSLRRALFVNCDLSSLNMIQGPPRGGDASRRKTVDIDLANIQVRDSHNLPLLIEHHLQIQDGIFPGMTLPTQPGA